MSPALSAPNHKVQVMFSTRHVSQGQPVAALQDKICPSTASRCDERQSEVLNLLQILNEGCARQPESHLSEFRVIQALNAQIISQL